MSCVGVDTEANEIETFFAESYFLISQACVEGARSLSFADGRLSFPESKVNAYSASVAVDFVRRKLLEKGISFTFGTVMPHPSKVAVLEHA